MIAVFALEVVVCFFCFVFFLFLCWFFLSC